MNYPFLVIIIAAVLHRSGAAPAYPKKALPQNSGYLTVNSTTGSAIYYTYYEAQNPIGNTPISKTPILIWLEGGPGCASLTANYFQIGPWIVNQNISLEPNPGPWNNIFGLLFLDNPIGTGFSIAASPAIIVISLLRLNTIQRNTPIGRLLFKPCNTTTRSSQATQNQIYIRNFSNTLATKEIDDLTNI